jgi:hypothetical protein
MASLLCLASLTWAQAPDAKNSTAVLSAAKSENSVTVESKGGALSYKAVVDGKNGGDIGGLHLPADGDVIAGQLNDIFFLGTHAEDYTLRGWTGPNKFTITCSVDLVSQKPDEVVVQVNLLTTGTFKILATDPTIKAELRKAHSNYKDKTIQLKRIYTFKPDRVVVNDELLWVHPDMEMKTLYYMSSFMPGQTQGPARLINGETTSSFSQTGSGGEKVPAGIAYPFVAENFLKNGFKVSLRTTATSFDLAKSDMYYHEKSWQQDWDQVSGFMYRVTGTPADKPVTFTNEIVFSKATAAEMPPVVTILSPPWNARWMDEKGEVAPHKIGETLKLAATALNSDGTPVPDKDITWEIHIDPWWNTPAATLSGGNVSYTIPEVTNEEDKTKSKDRNLQAVLNVKVKGKNGTEAVEPFAMLVGKAEQ